MNLIRLKPKLITLASVLMALSGCAQVAEVMGYDTQTLNAAAAKSYTQMIGRLKPTVKLKLILLLRSV